MTLMMWLGVVVLALAAGAILGRRRPPAEHPLKFADIVRDDTTLRTSSSKVLTIGTWAVASGVVIIAAYRGNAVEGMALLLAVYITGFVANSTVSKWLGTRAGGIVTPSTTPGA